MEAQAPYARLAEHYDAIYHWKDYAGEAARLRELLAAEGVAPGAGARLLEAGCGTGEHMRHLRAWYDVSGFDLSEDMLAVARWKLPGAALFRADMTDFAVERPFDAIVSLFSAIGYVYPEERLRAAARAFAAAVRPGGALIVEPWLTDATFKPGRLTMHTYDADDLKLARATISRKEGDRTVFDMHWLILRTGARDVEHVVEHHELWLCPTETLLRAFEDAGFACRFERDGFMKDRGLVIGRRR